MSPDEWIHRGMEYSLKVWESRSEDQDGGGAGGENQDIADELKYLDRSIECFGKTISLCIDGQIQNIHPCILSHFHMCVDHFSVCG